MNILDYDIAGQALFGPMRIEGKCHEVNLLKALSLNIYEITGNRL